MYQSIVYFIATSARMTIFNFNIFQVQYYQNPVDWVHLKKYINWKKKIDTQFSPTLIIEKAKTYEELWVNKPNSWGLNKFEHLTII